MVGSAFTEVVAFVGRLWRLEPLDFGPVMRLIPVALEDWDSCDRVSETPAIATDDGVSAIGAVDVDSVVMVAFVSTRLSEEVDGLDEWLGAIEDRLDGASDGCAEASFDSLDSLGTAFVGLLPPTASRNLLYNPLRPFCTRSPAPARLSEAGVPSGGGAKSLNVVRVSHRLAEVCILSRAYASCSLSMVDDMEVVEPRRGLKLIGDPSGPGEGDPAGGLDALPLAMIRVCMGADGLAQSIQARRRKPGGYPIGLTMRASLTSGFT